MNAKHRFAFAIVCLFVASVLAQPATAQYDKLIQRVPTSVNTIILLNVEKIMESEIALKEGWRSNFERAVQKGITRLPGDTQQYVMASQTDFEYMHPIWQVGILATKGKHDMVYIASKKNGAKDTVAGMPAVLLPSQNYLVQLDAKTYATMVPASRQAVTRWLTSTADAKPEFSPYIKEAIGFAAKAGTEVIMAMDLADVMDVPTITKLIEESKPIIDAKIDQAAAIKALASLRGITLGITFQAKPYGSIKVDFGEDVSLLKEVAPELMAGALEKHGAMIDDFKTWKGSIKGNQLLFSGYLSDDGMRKVFSLMDPPTADSVAAHDVDADGQSASEQMTPAEATQKYFSSVEQYFRDLRNKEPQRIAQYGIWFDKYARKIDQLPMLNVDEEMLNYGAYVAQQFRNAGAAIQGIGVRSRVRQVQGNNSIASGYNAGNGGYNYGGYYYGGYGITGSYTRGNRMVGAGYANRVANFNAAQQAGLRSQQRMGTQVRVEEKAMGTSAARAIMKDLDGATAQIRRNMTEKYKVEFK